MYMDRGYPRVVFRVGYGFLWLVVLFGVYEAVRARGAVRVVVILVLLVDDLGGHCFGARERKSANRNTARPQAEEKHGVMR